MKAKLVFEPLDIEVLSRDAKITSIEASSPFIYVNIGVVDFIRIDPDAIKAHLEFEEQEDASNNTPDSWQDAEELVEKLRKLYEDAKARLEEMKK